MDVSRVSLRRYYIVICMKVTCRARNVMHFAAQVQGFVKVTRLCRYFIGISVWRVVFWGCWMWPCHWGLRFRVWHRSAVFVTSFS